MQYTYRVHGVCSTQVSFAIEEDGTIRNIQFTGGCPGNLKAVGKLAEGMEAARVAQILAGNTCGHKQTSCADQLARCIRAALEEQIQNKEKLQEDSVS